MSDNFEDKRSVSFPVQNVRYAQEHLIAASGLLGAISHQYAQEGVLSVGAVLHVANVIDGVIEKLNLASMEIDQQLLPF